MNRKTKWSHRLLALALAAVMCCTYLPIGAFAETPPPQETTVAAEERQTNETETDNGQTDASSPDPGAATAEIAAPTTDEPAEESEPYTFDGEILYADMPDAPTGSYLGSYGLPVATGETKIGLGAWDADLEQDIGLSYLYRTAPVPCRLTHNRQILPEMLRPQTDRTGTHRHHLPARSCGSRQKSHRRCCPAPYRTKRFCVLARNPCCGTWQGLQTSSRPSCCGRK